MDAIGADAISNAIARADAAMPSIVYSTLDAAWELLNGARAAAETCEGLEHVSAELDEACDRAANARDMARRRVFADGGVVVPRG